MDALPRVHRTPNPLGTDRPLGHIFLFLGSATLAIGSVFIPSNLWQLFGLGLATAVVFRRNAYDFPTLLLLSVGHLIIAGFLADPYGGWSLNEALSARGDTGDASPAHISGMTFALAGMSAATVIRVSNGFFRANRSLALLANLWIVTLGFASLSALTGYLQGSNGWSIPLRIAFVFGAFFWVFTCANYDARYWSYVRRAIRLSVAVSAGLLATDAGMGRAMFLAAALNAAGCVAAVRANRRLLTGLTVLGLTGSAFFYSFTAAAIALVALAAALPIASPHSRHHDTLARGAVAIALLAGLAVVGLGVSAADSAGRVDAKYQVVSRLLDKIFMDRAPIWQAAHREVRSGNLIADPGGQDLVLYDYPIVGLGHQLWIGGAHNTWLELARQFGYVAALAPALLLLGILFLTASSVGAMRSAFLRVLACAAVASVAVGVATGQFPIQEEVGGALMVMLGLSVRAGQGSTG